MTVGNEDAVTMADQMRVRLVRGAARILQTIEFLSYTRAQIMDLRASTQYTRAH